MSSTCPFDRLTKAFIRRPFLTHEEFIETHMKITSKKVSGFLGTVKLARSPQLRMVFKLADKKKTRQIWLMWASQTGKTLAISIPAAKAIYDGGGFIHWIYPVKDKVKDLIKAKFAPTFKSIPIVWNMFEAYRNDESLRDNAHFKETATGGIYITGVTANDLKSVSVPFTIGDEIGEMPKGTMTEAEERQKSYTRVFPRTIGASTKVHPHDEIHVGHNSAQCKLEYHFVCPSCNDTFDDHRDKFKFLSREAYAKREKIEVEDVKEQKYLEAAIPTAHVECPHCEYQIYEEEREKMLYDGVGADWVVVEGDLETAETFGLTMGSLTAWVVTLKSALLALDKARNSPEEMDKVLRNWFNEFPKHTKETTKNEDLWLLDSRTPELQVPADTYKLVMSLDNQKNRVYLAIDALTYDNNQITIFAEEVMAHGGRDWDVAEEMFYNTYHDEEGNGYQISMFTVDFRGYNEKDVNRILEAKKFVKKLLVQLRDENNQEQEVWGVYGVDNIKDDRPFTTPVRKTVIEGEEYNIPIMNMNNRVIKMSMLMDSENIRGAIPRTIAKIKDQAGEYEPLDEWDNPRDYNTGLYYVNSDIIEREKQTFEKLGRLPYNEFTNHLRAETFDPIKNMYVNEHGRRNDYADCIFMNALAAIKLEVANAERPDPQEAKAALEAVKRFSGFNRG